MHEDSTPNDSHIWDPTEPLGSYGRDVALYFVASTVPLLFAVLLLRHHGLRETAAAVLWVGVCIPGLLTLLLVAHFLSRRYVVLCVSTGVSMFGVGWNFLVLAFAVHVELTSGSIVDPAALFSIIGGLSIALIACVDRVAAKAVWRNNLKGGRIDLESGVFDPAIQLSAPPSSETQQAWRAAQIWVITIGVVVALILGRVLVGQARINLLALSSVVAYFVFSSFGWLYGFGLAIRAWTCERSMGKALKIRRPKSEG